MAVGTTIKTIQDIMRKDAGVDGDAQRISQLGWMLFLKIFDDKEKEYELFKKGYRSPMPDRLRWRNWATDTEGITGEALLKFIDTDLFPTLRELPAEAGSNGSGILLRKVFEDSYNYMKNGTLIRQVANKINEIDFNKTEDRHLFGEIYEKILKDLQSAGNAGEFYTPRAVTQFMVDQVNPKLGESILDPACGTGGFLACAIENIRKTVKTIEDEELLQNSIHGVEKKQMPHLLCVTNMMLHGIDVPIQIRRDNTLARPLKDYTARDRVDVIVTNPPFGGMEEDGIESNFPASVPDPRDRRSLPRPDHAHPQGRRQGRDRAPRRDAFWRGREEPDQGEASRRVQPPYHRPAPERRLCPLYRDQDEPALFRERQADKRDLVLRAHLSRGLQVV